jgi:hypothetical protein
MKCPTANSQQLTPLKHSDKIQVPPLLTFKNSAFSQHIALMSDVSFSQQIAITSVNSINQLALQWTGTVGVISLSHQCSLGLCSSGYGVI